MRAPQLEGPSLRAGKKGLCDLTDIPVCTFCPQRTSQLCLEGVQKLPSRLRKVCLEEDLLWAQGLGLREFMGGT